MRELLSRILDVLAGAHRAAEQGPVNAAFEMSALHLTPEEWHDSLDAQIDELFRTVRACELAEREICRAELRYLLRVVRECERAWTIFPPRQSR